VLVHSTITLDTLRLVARQLDVWTDAPGGTARTATSEATATWRRRMSVHVDGWMGAGATLASYDPGLGHGGVVTDLLPAAEVGIARSGEGLGFTGEATGRVTTFVDGFTGEVAPYAEAAFGIRWRAAPRVAFASSASGGVTRGAETRLARAALRGTWSPRDRLAVEVGFSGRLQRERRPDLPSFDEVGSFAGVAWTMRERLTLQAGVMARVHREFGRPDASYQERAAFAGFAYATERLFQSVM